MNFDPLEELKEANRRLRLTKGKNVWGRKLLKQPKQQAIRPALQKKRGRPSLLSPEQLAEFKRRYPTEGPKQMSVEFGRPIQSLYVLAQRCGVKRQKVNHE
jgi:transposase